MKISLSPVGLFKSLVVERTAPDRLRINGELFNFGPLNDGDVIPSGFIPCEWIVGPVTRSEGDIHLTLLLPHGASPDAHVAFPAPILDPPIGIVDLPFSQWCEVLEEQVEGGINRTTKIHRWQQSDEVSVEFIPNPIEEPSHVDA